MAELSAEGKFVALYAAAVGIPVGRPLAQAVAIGLAESEGNPEAVGDEDNPRPGCTSVGIWQINSCPNRDGSGPPRFGNQPDKLKDPLVNAQSMKEISANGSDWGPWSTWWGNPRTRTGPGRGDRFRRFQREGEVAMAWVSADDEADRLVREITGGANPADIGRGVGLRDIPGLARGIANEPFEIARAALESVTNVLRPIADFLGLITSGDTWRRVLFVVAGVVLVIGAIALVVADQKEN